MQTHKLLISVIRYEDVEKRLGPEKQHEHQALNFRHCLALARFRSWAIGGRWQRSGALRVRVDPASHAPGHGMELRPGRLAKHGQRTGIPSWRSKRLSASAIPITHMVVLRRPVPHSLVSAGNGTLSRPRLADGSQTALRHRCGLGVLLRWRTRGSSLSPLSGSQRHGHGTVLRGRRYWHRAVWPRGRSLAGILGRGCVAAGLAAAGATGGCAVGLALARSSQTGRRRPVGIAPSAFTEWPVDTVAGLLLVRRRLYRLHDFHPGLDAQSRLVAAVRPEFLAHPRERRRCFAFRLASGTEQLATGAYAVGQLLCHADRRVDSDSGWRGSQPSLLGCSVRPWHVHRAILGRRAGASAHAIGSLGQGHYVFHCGICTRAGHWAGSCRGDCRHGHVERLSIVWGGTVISGCTASLARVGLEGCSRAQIGRRPE